MHPRRLYAHRGASAMCPENTMVAFQRALDLGCDALEMDVHLTRDGQLIVAHDDEANRTCGVNIAWGALDLVEAQRLDAGWGFLSADGSRPFAGQGIHAPLFSEVLATYPHAHINVDIKGERSVDVMLGLLREHGAEDRVTIASFQTRTLIDVRRKKFAGETGLAQGEVIALITLPAIAWRQLPWTGNAAQLPTHQGPIRFDRAPFIAKCHSIGLRVDYWVIDDAAEAARLLELGADGIMTNDPEKIAPLFRDGNNLHNFDAPSPRAH